MLDDTITFKAATLEALRAFKASHPWRGTPAERLAKFRRLNRRLATIYGIEAPKVVVTQGPGCYMPSAHRIYLRNLSVVTYLHEFGHARGWDERQTCRWSLNLFRRVFPRQFARCAAPHAERRQR